MDEGPEWTENDDTCRHMFRYGSGATDVARCGQKERPHTGHSALVVRPGSWVLPVMWHDDETTEHFAGYAALDDE